MTQEHLNGLPVYETTDGSFFCPKCRRKHHHGLVSEIGEPDHRVEHCDNPKAHPGGYYIKKVAPVSRGGT